MSKCPEYYRLADGREFVEYSLDLTRILWAGGIVGVPYHCAISALEHLFRLGRKEGEAETDWASFVFWWSRVPNTHAKRVALMDVVNQRKKVGDYDKWLASQEWIQVYGAESLWSEKMLKS